MLEIRPITYRDAAAYVNAVHRHHKAPAGCKFALSCWDGERLCGVALCGRPVSRHEDNGFTLEINRVATDGTRNACSKLYGACVKVAGDMGYRRVITYTLESEDGASVKAANFTCEGRAGGTHWTGARDKGQPIPNEMKTKWSVGIKRRSNET